MHRRLVASLAVAALALFASCSGKADASGAGAESPKLAFVTNCVADFWTIARAGTVAAGKELGVDVEFHAPPNGTAAEQKQILEDLETRGVDGIALSPKDPDNQTALLDRLAAARPLITHDSDAPKSARLCYVGMDNYAAGRLCGQLVKEALPTGGKVAILVGTLDQDNARGRRQGLIDELLDRPRKEGHWDSQDAALRSARYEIVATFTDGFDRVAGKNAAADALVRFPDLACMVGLFEYEPPLILEAVKEAQRLGRVQIVAFDEAAATLQAIADGQICGTVVQNPYDYGYHSVRILTALARGDRAVLPADGFFDIPARVIRKDNVEAFRADLAQKLGRK
jgi:ribose transport system substrate-binding protein